MTISIPERISCEPPDIFMLMKLIRHYGKKWNSNSKQNCIDYPKQMMGNGFRLI